MRERERVCYITKVVVVVEVGVERESKIKKKKKIVREKERGVVGVIRT